MTKILLVEDNDMNLDMLSRRLMRRGYDVVVASNGAEGLAKIKTDQPDIVLMDMNLPIIDGWEATRRLKVDPTTQNIPVLALTAHAMSGDRQKALDSGCSDYDTKPIELSRLISKIEALLQHNKDS